MPFTVPPVVAEGTMRDSDQPTLDLGDGMKARPPSPDDAPWIVEAFTDPAIRRWHMRDLTLEDAETWINESAKRWTAETGANWVVADSDGQPLGRVGMHDLELNFGHAEIGYWVLPHARGRGVAKAAVSGFSDWAFDLGLHRLELCHSVDNQPSCEVARVTAYTFEGILRSALKHEDGWHDMHIHARIAGD